MRVLVLHSRYRWLGGEETTVERMVDMLEEGGHQTRLHEVPNPTEPIPATGAVLLAPWNPVQYRHVLQIIDEFQPDVAHVHNTWFALSPSVITACERRGVPVVMTIQNYRMVCPQGQLFRDGRVCTDCVGRFPAPGIRHRCYRGSMGLSAVNAATTRINHRVGTWASVKVVHVPAEFTRTMLQSGPLHDSKFAVFPNAVPDLGVRSQSPSQSDVVLFVGRISKEKGLDLVVDAWARTQPSGLHLKIIGDGPERPSLMSRALDGVEFVGHVAPDDVRSEMMSARALVFPSKWFEVCPMVIVEALAAGLPVIAHDLGATPELLVDTIHPTLVAPDDPRGWDEALRVLTNDDVVDELGGMNRSRYLERHTLDSWLSSHEAMYRKALGQT